MGDNEYGGGDADQEHQDHHEQGKDTHMFCLSMNCHYYLLMKVREMRTGGMMAVGEKMDQVDFEGEVVGGALEEEVCGGLGEDLDLQVVGLAEGLDQVY